MSPTLDRYRAILAEIVERQAADTLTEAEELDLLDELADLWWELEEGEREALEDGFRRCLAEVADRAKL